MEQRRLQSWKDYMSSLGKLGIGLYFVNLGLLIMTLLNIFWKPIVFPKEVWLSLLIVGLVFTPFIAFHNMRIGLLQKLNDKEDENKSFKNKMSSVEVTPKPVWEWATLSVKNCGQYEASFSVKVLALNADGLKLVNRDIHRVIPYDVTWKGMAHHTAECLIESGNSHEIDITKITGWGGKMEDGIASLDIYTAPETINAEIPIGKGLKLVIEVFAKPKLKEPYKKLIFCILTKSCNQMECPNGKNL